MNGLRDLLSQISCSSISLPGLGFAVSVLVSLVGGFPANAATAPLPTATVSNVTLPPSIVVRTTPYIAVAATVKPAFDVNSGPTSVQTSCGSCASGNQFCSTGNSSIKSQQVLNTTTITVANTMMNVRAAPQFGSADPTTAVLTLNAGG